jgi:hypothetical protein
MPSTMDRMSTLDAELFYAEHDNMPMHIGSVAVFDGPAPTREDLMRLFEAKLPRVPRYRQKDSWCAAWSRCRSAARTRPAPSPTASRRCWPTCRRVSRIRSGGSA